MCFKAVLLGAGASLVAQGSRVGLQCRDRGLIPELEKEMATHSNTLGNPRDRGAWWATVHGVAKESDTT